MECIYWFTDYRSVFACPFFGCVDFVLMSFLYVERVSFSAFCASIIYRDRPPVSYRTRFLLIVLKGDLRPQYSSSDGVGKCVLMRYIQD